MLRTAFKSSQTTGLTNENVNDGFQFTFNANAQPTTSPNLDVARVNAFYIVNTIHVRFSDRAHRVVWG